MIKKLVDKDKAFEMYYALGTSRSLPKLYSVMSRKCKGNVPTERTLKDWSGKYKWQNRIVIRDNATYEGVAEKMTEAQVDTKLKELEHLDRAMSEIDGVMPLICDALTACTIKDKKTGKRHVTILPESTSDMAALYNAQSRFITAKTKLIETMRKVRGESDNVNLKTVLEVRYEELTEKDGRD